MTRLVCLLVLALMAATPATAKVWSVGRNPCAALIEHQPSPDVAYKPGVDVRGRPVMSADLGGGPQIKPPDEISIDIEVPLSKAITMPADAKYRDSPIRLGQVKVRNGHAYYNGKPLSSDTQAQLAAKCRERKNKNKG